jgi:hypothetical protein
MRIVFGSAALGFAICLAAVSLALVSPEDKYEFAVRDGRLCQGRQPFLLNAIEAPSLLQQAKDPEELARCLNRAADVGANSICFDLSGFSADGTALSAEVVKTIDAVMRQVTWRRMGALCRVLGAEVPNEAAVRAAAAKAAATALKSENRVVYWIDGPNSAELADQFHRQAPDVVVATERGGAVDAVSAVPEQPGAKPVLLVGSIPPAELRDKIHFVLPSRKDSYAALDAAMADPAESKPWTPAVGALSEQERGEGFVPLFDGKSFDGWWILGENKRGFAVEDGAIKWQTLGGRAVYTRDRYDNFVLRLEWQINKKGNSGIYLRAPRAGRQSKIGMEFQLQGDAGEPVTNQTSGALYSVLAPRVNAGKPAGEWNTVEITLNGPVLKAVLNGEVVQDVNFDQNEELRPRLRRGFIGLQDHGTYVAFRNIRIKKL